MAILTTKKRKSLEKSHAANAKARAQQQYNKGNLSKEELNMIDRKANTKLYGKDSPRKKVKKGRRKMGTNMADYIRNNY